MRTIRAIAAAACFGACAFAGPLAWSCDERFAAACKTKAGTQTAAAAASASEATPSPRAERRRSARYERRAKLRTERRERTRLARAGRLAAGADGADDIIPAPKDAPHRATQSLTSDDRAFVPAVLLTSYRLGTSESAAFVPAVVAGSQEPQVDKAAPTRQVAVIAASHLLAASTSAAAAEMLGISPANAATPRDVQRASIFSGWGESGAMRILFLTFAALLTFGTALRLAM